MSERTTLPCFHLTEQDAARPLVILVGDARRNPEVPPTDLAVPPVRRAQQLAPKY